MTETHQHEEHVHGENCDHTHEEHHDDAQHLSHKKNKEQKKFVKIMKKQNLKQVDGITRVTLRTTKNLVMYIDNPVIMKSGNSYVVFGEPQYLDFQKNFSQKNAEKIIKE